MQSFGKAMSGSQKLPMPSSLVSRCKGLPMTVQLALIETYRDMASSMLAIYLSSFSNRLNSVMHVLTLIASIFISLTFIVGVYDMNFDRKAGLWSMPELGQPLRYVTIWLVMIAIAVSRVIFFRSRRWS